MIGDTSTTITVTTLVLLALPTTTVATTTTDYCYGLLLREGAIVTSTIVSNVQVTSGTSQGRTQLCTT